MSDNDIVKALECLCGDEVLCRECAYGHIPYPVCKQLAAKKALDIINRQRAEILELEAEIDKQYEQAKADILGNMADGGTSCHWCIDRHRAKAIKEFAERLKIDFGHGVLGMNSVAAIIDNLVKEMTEATP